MYKDDMGLNQFYMHRGCHLVRKPAVLHLNWLTGAILRGWLPRHHAKLCGQVDELEGGQAPDKATTTEETARPAELKGSRSA